MSAEQAVFSLLVAGTALYAVLGGADFGAGIWEALAGRRFSRAEREFVYGAIGPAWEANHVWLIFTLVVMFSAFPAAFAWMTQELWLPLLLALLGMVLRGSAYGFRSAQDPEGAGQSLWRAVFAAGSLVAPFFLGIVALTMAGLIPVPQAGVSARSIPRETILAGLAGLSACAALSAGFLAMRARKRGPVDASRTWGRRAIAAGVLLAFVVAALILLYSPDRPHMAWAEAQAPASVLKAILIVVAIGAVPLVAALVALFRFSRENR